MATTWTNSGYKLIFTVGFPKEPQMCIISTSIQAKIIMSAYDGWYQWAAKDHGAYAWKLEVYEGTRLLKKAGRKTWLLNSEHTIN